MPALRDATRILLFCFAGFLLSLPAFAQAPDVYARSFYKQKDDIEQALKALQVSAGEKLPILDGFVGETEQPLDRYERGFCKFSVELVPSDAGKTVVTVKAKITAWYADRDVAKSGYQVLPSNGRLELDFLDRLEEKLIGKPVSSLRNHSARHSGAASQTGSFWSSEHVRHHHRARFYASAR